MLVSYSVVFIIMLLKLCFVFYHSIDEELSKEDVDSETCNKFFDVQIEKTGGCCHNSESCQECGELTVGQYTCVHIYARPYPEHNDGALPNYGVEATT